MCFRIKLDNLSAEQKQNIRRSCVIDQSESVYSETVQHVCFKIVDDYIYLPFALWQEILRGKFPMYNLPTTTVEFTGKLLTKETDVKKRDQDLIVEESIKLLSVNRSCFLALATSTGKTCISAYLSAYLKKKTIFLSFSDTINKQTVKEYQKFTTAKVQHIKGNVQSIDPSVDVYIVGVRKAYNLLLEREDCFSDVGTVIIDEAHLCTSFVFTNLMFYFQPDFLIGMSATPDRKDGMHSLFKLFFGSQEDYIIRKEIKSFTIIKVNTNYEPECRKIYVKGRYVLDWTTVISSLCMNEERNNTIVKLAKRLTESDCREKIIILGGRIEQCNYIYQKLLELKVYTDILTGKKKDYDENATIIVGGIKKIGVGFNDPTRTILILATNVADVRQSEGRIRTINNKIYDLVDNHPRLTQHWSQRKRWYISRGATIIESDAHEYED